MPACPGFGVKVTPKGRKVFVVLYRTGGAGSKLRKYTIGPYGRVTLHQARVAAQKVFAAKLEGRDPAAEKREAKRRVVADRVEDLLETFIAQHVSQNRSAGEISRLLRREVGKPWAGRSIHEISKRDVVEVVSAIEQRGAPDRRQQDLEVDQDVPALVRGPSRSRSIPGRRRPAAREGSCPRSRAQPTRNLRRSSSRRGGSAAPMAALLNFWRSRAAPGRSRRDDMGRVGSRAASLDASQIKDKECQSPCRAPFRTINGCAQTSTEAAAVRLLVLGTKPFQEFSRAKRQIDELSGVTGMAAS